MRAIEAIQKALADAKTRRDIALKEKAKADKEAARWAAELAEVNRDIAENEAVIGELGKPLRVARP